MSQAGAGPKRPNNIFAHDFSSLKAAAPSRFQLEFSGQILRLRFAEESAKLRLIS
jgi:hypothetical protein